MTRRQAIDGVACLSLMGFGLEKITSWVTTKAPVIEWNAHIFNPDISRYPIHPKATYTPDMSVHPSAPLATYLQKLA